MFGDNTKGFYDDMFGGRISRDACEANDCLHPCYGASHEANCSKCLTIARSKVSKGKDFLPLSKKEAAVCNHCTIPAPEFDTSIPSFEQWMADVRAGN